MNRKFVVAFGLCLAACSAPAPDEAPVPDQTVTTQPVTETVAPLSARDLVRVCRGGASFRNGTDIQRINTENAGENMIRLSYTRTDDKFFAYDCMVEGNVVRYRMIDEAGPGTGPGTWSGRGSRTTFKIFPNEIEFTDDFFDGSTDVDRVKV
ncbi:hypothetical protein [Blastomonas fulva]|uniref:hypothetical protein n=1 Tax=Blastomonas fulva TaxID=1550728 RepID=UPI003F725F1E